MTLKVKHIEFYKISKCKGGYDPQCKDCRRETRRENPRTYRSSKPKITKIESIYSPIITKGLSDKEISLASSRRCISCKTEMDSDGVNAGAVRCMECISSKKTRPIKANELIDDFAQVIYVDPNYFREDYI